MIMIRRMRHAAAVLAMACMMTVMMPAQMITAFAANARIAFSDPSATVGGKIKVNMKITSSDNLANADVMLSYDSNILEFVDGTNADAPTSSTLLRIWAALLPASSSPRAPRTSPPTSRTPSTPVQM